MPRILSAPLLIVSLLAAPLLATDYYVNPRTGKDTNAGTSATSAFKTLARVSTLKLAPGDQILLAGRQTHTGTLKLTAAAGTKIKPITIRSYVLKMAQPAKIKPRATIDGKGQTAAVHLINCSDVTVQDLTLTADGGGFPDKANTRLRAGVLVEAKTKGKYHDIHLNNLSIHDVYYNDKGFEREKRGDSKKENATFGYGIRVLVSSTVATLSNVSVTNCRVENVGHTGIKFSCGGGKRPMGLTDFAVTGNTLRKTGGPGMQVSGGKNGVFRNNDSDQSGNYSDKRKWGRGSGLWTWGSEDILIEYNRLTNAEGTGDSAGCHIDFNCKNVIVQYNFSANNAGGFCEILGNNHNCTYRYNVSVNDGWRVKGKDGAFMDGKVFWLSGYCGRGQKRNGPYNSYFYNNTIYVKKGLVAKIAADHQAAGVLIMNNIFHFVGTSKGVKGDQHRPEQASVNKPSNVLFKNNLYLRASNWPSEVRIQDTKKLLGAAKFAKPGGMAIKDYIPRNRALVKDKGLAIPMLPGDKVGLVGGLKVKTDILGTPITGQPDLGAIEVK
ncbi:MAG: right-handed parallel beta-helix repeat-containing protein [Phycisphaerales bacterium]|jgi:hypothetical protein|nr:right-handed parallel beta-helix repeat-containing protein [Phycisphaerales bacterium]MBT7170668.1 right-handed parallel beta-helix repeat-containing protein [Phycisphaerales bacterium]